MDFLFLMKIQVSTHLVLTIENEKCLSVYLIMCIVHDFWIHVAFFIFYFLFFYYHITRYVAIAAYW